MMYLTCMTMVKEDLRKAFAISKENGIYNVLVLRR